MAAESGSLQFARRSPFTVDDLEAMPDDGSRYELINGMLLVSLPPDLHHQTIVGNLAVALKAACPSDMHTLVAPFAVQFSKKTELQPDVLVGRKEDFTRKHLPVAPVLAVEVFSPSSRLNDMNNKKAVYEEHGAQSYWVIDPEAPALIAFELDDTGLYQTVAKVEAPTRSKPSGRSRCGSSRPNYLAGWPTSSQTEQPRPSARTSSSM